MNESGCQQQASIIGGIQGMWLGPKNFYSFSYTILISKLQDGVMAFCCQDKFVFFLRLKSVGQFSVIHVNVKSMWSIFQ